ncbi:unnamed protein product [Trypanosoma congolense IL3000]|uniref:WGS project CAEQ00000000 data, annotated contig 1739 n=1 Tax=Trypanosoma congolense (strain IL3000) TaxID=1068625 RepID=F9W8J6_TRYCI|nr:unnamed protein product [Trypanosoma congolense IL3000]
MYQLEAVPGRKFAALRVDLEVEECHALNESVCSRGSDQSELGPTERHINDTLGVLLGVFNLEQRQKLLKSLCERWGVPLPRKSPGVWDEAFGRRVRRMIALRVGRVADVGMRNSVDSNATRFVAFSPLALGAGDCPVDFEEGASAAECLDVRRSSLPRA